MITNFQISDFAKRKTEVVGKVLGRELTGQERSQCSAFFNNMGSTFQRHSSKGTRMNFDEFERRNAPDVVREAYEIEGRTLTPA